MGLKRGGRKNLALFTGVSGNFSIEDPANKFECIEWKYFRLLNYFQLTYGGQVLLQSLEEVAIEFV